jgi:hypothetical protein
MLYSLQFTFDYLISVIYLLFVSFHDGGEKI